MVVQDLRFQGKLPVWQVGELFRCKNVMHVILCVLAGMFKVDCITALHRQTYWLSWCHAVTGRATRHPSFGHQLSEKVCRAVFLYSTIRISAFHFLHIVSL